MGDSAAVNALDRMTREYDGKKGNKVIWARLDDRL